MTNTIDTLSNNRRYVIIGVAITFGLWQIPQMDIFSSLNASLKPFITGVNTLGALAWIICMILLFVIQRRLSRASTDTNAILDDELVKANRMNAVKHGYITLFGLSALIFAACQIMDISGSDVARTLMIAGVCVPLLSFGILER